VGSGGNAGDGEAAIISGQSAESGPLDYDVDSGERLSGGAVDYLTSDGASGLLGSEGIEGCCGTQDGTGEQGEEAVG
jgi:hypothetical protein